MIGVQTDRVAFAVTDDGDESVGPDTELGLEDPSSVLSGQGGLDFTVFAGEINQGALGAGLFHGVKNERTARAMLTSIPLEHEHLNLRIPRRQGCEGLVKDGLVEFPGSIQIGNMNLEPANRVL